MKKGRPKKTTYSLELIVNEKKHIAKGNDLVSMLEEVRPEFYKTKGEITVTKGDTMFNRVLYIPQMKRLFNEFPSMTREIARATFCKNVEMMME